MSGRAAPVTTPEVEIPVRDLTLLGMMAAAEGFSMADLIEILADASEDETASVDICTLGELGASIIGRAPHVYVRFIKKRGPSVLAWELFSEGTGVEGAYASIEVIRAAVKGAPPDTDLWPIAHAIDFDIPDNDLARMVEQILVVAPSVKTIMRESLEEHYEGEVPPKTALIVSKKE